MMFQTMWDTFKVSPTVLYVNSQELRNITKKVLAGSSNTSLLCYNEVSGQQKMDITASGMVRWYYNPIAPPDTGQRLCHGNESGTQREQRRVKCHAVATALCHSAVASAGISAGWIGRRDGVED
jgi:hypothetical protein